MQIFRFIKKSDVVSVCSIWKVIITNAHIFNIRFLFYSPPASWVAHITMHFLTCCSCLYSSIMLLTYLYILNDYFHLSYLVLPLNLYYESFLLLIPFTYCFLNIGLTLDCKWMVYSFTIFSYLLLTYLYCLNYSFYLSCLVLLLTNVSLYFEWFFLFIVSSALGLSFTVIE